MVDDPSSHPEKFPTEEAQERERERLFGIIRTLMQKQLHKHPEVYAEARAEMLEVLRTGSCRPCWIPSPGAARSRWRRPGWAWRRMPGT
ncbi:MAG: hypothetical protein KatS3mg123_1758 [Burkholderiales bacterium]|nr:MAG: hypothetical protein KatS3mg123_1758 [Burkholderiales bacterium]